MLRTRESAVSVEDAMSYEVYMHGDHHYSFSRTVAKNIATLADAIALMRELDQRTRGPSSGCRGYEVRTSDGKTVYPVTP